ncbi:MAG: hypothetical protein J5I90_07470 [Caldilineales bacterium]|nr:hypothetical protein [Caldilineales bacterium]
MAPPSPYLHELHTAFSQSGCPICRLLADSVDHYLDSVLWEMVTDPKLRGELNEARGYCQKHGWMLVRPGGALGVAIMMQGVIRAIMRLAEGEGVKRISPSSWQQLLNNLENAERMPDLGKLVRALERGSPDARTARIGAALSPQILCPACSYEESMEEHYLSGLLQHLPDDDELAQAYQNSDGLCLNHFRLALMQARPGPKLDSLTAAQLVVWQRLDVQLGEFIRKNDHRFRGEAFGAEEDSWRRALEAISGPPPADPKQRQGLTQSR